MRGAIETGDQVHLRRLSARDRRPFLDAVRRSRRLHGRWVEAPETPQEFDDYLRRSRRPDAVAFLVRRNEDDAICGVVSMGQIHLGPFKSAYLGYYAFEPLAGRGYMTEGLRLVLRHAFKSMGLHRLEANVQPQNAVSIALVERLGFRREGYSPRYLKIGGRWRDHIRYAILAEDFVTAETARRARSPRDRA